MFDNHEIDLDFVENVKRRFKVAISASERCYFTNCCITNKYFKHKDTTKLRYELVNSADKEIDDRTDIIREIKQKGKINNYSTKIAFQEFVNV